MLSQIPHHYELDLDVSLSGRNFTANACVDENFPELSVVAVEGDFEIEAYCDGTCSAQVYAYWRRQDGFTMPLERVLTPTLGELERAITDYLNQNYAEELEQIYREREEDAALERQRDNDLD